MSTWGILIGPIIIAVVVGLVILVCVIIALCSFLEENHARRTEEKTRTLLLSDTFRKTVLLCHQQGDAISEIICELEKYPASARVLGQEAVTDLYAAHTQLQQTQLEGKL